MYVSRFSFEKIPLFWEFTFDMIPLDFADFTLLIKIKLDWHKTARVSFHHVVAMNQSFPKRYDMPTWYWRNLREFHFEKSNPFLLKICHFFLPKNYLTSKNHKIGKIWFIEYCYFCKYWLYVASKGLSDIHI